MMEDLWAVTMAIGLAMVLGMEELASGVAHASFEPQASAFEKFESGNVVVVVDGARSVDFAAGWVGADRLNAEDMLEEG